MEFLIEYGMFLAKWGTVIVLLFVCIGGLLILAHRDKDETQGFNIQNLNEYYENISMSLNMQMLSEKELKKYLKQQKQNKKEVKEAEDDKRNVFVLDFKGNIKASAVSSLREEITAILSIAKPKDEIIVLLESAGGTVHGYGLGASQLQRIRDKDIKLTVAVDKMAASGGYMMACVANKIIAAPFAIIGSIGVLAQIPNFYRLLKKMDIDFEEITAGDYKRTLSMFAENTDQGREKFRQEIDEAHDLFKEFVKNHRAQVDIDQISTGEHWYGKKALALKLVDELITSDDYLFNLAKDTHIYKLTYETKKPISEKLISLGANLLTRLSK